MSKKEPKLITVISNSNSLLVSGVLSPGTAVEVRTFGDIMFFSLIVKIIATTFPSVKCLRFLAL